MAAKVSHKAASESRKGLLRLLNGDPRRLDLARSDHRLFETHPILNSLVLHHLAHGDLSGGIRFIESPRHESYLHHAGFEAEVERLRRHMGWPALEAGYYQDLRAARSPAA